MEESKHVFAGFYLDEFLVDTFRMLLSRALHTKVEVKKIGNCFWLSVSDSQYEKALIQGTAIAYQMGASLKWVNGYQYLLPLRYMSILYGFLPMKQKDMLFENFASADPVHPYLIQQYVTDLQNFLEGNPVMIQYRPNVNAVELLVEGDFSKRDVIVEKCKVFHEHFVHPFLNVVFTEINGKIPPENFSKILSKEKNFF